jgi:anhydro-N-acetylmuramic acid kinase
LHFEVATAFAAAALAVIRSAGYEPHDVQLIGTHGQTLFHHAPYGSGQWAPGMATWQAGSLPVISARTGIVTIGDFRSADVALGGTGAPLVPYVDWLLRRSDVENRILLNIGGIANLTYLGAGAGPESVLAWDVGPGNMVMDGLATILLGRERDEDGVEAGRGQPDMSLVEARLQAEYFARPVPKSAGREQFGAAYVEALRRDAAVRGLRPTDVLATAVELTARGIQQALRRPPLENALVDTVYVTGGGRHNRALWARLETLLAPAAVKGFEALGLPADAKEAVDFAILANESLHGYATNLTQVTGASRPCVLGCIALAAIPPRSLVP